MCYLIYISTDAARCCERPISYLTCHGSLHIEQKNPFIQNFNKHMYNFEKLSPVTKSFGQSWLEILSKYYLKKCHFTSPCYDFIKPSNVLKAWTLSEAFTVTILKTVIFAIACLNQYINIFIFMTFRLLVVCSKFEKPGMGHLLLPYLTFSFLVSALFQVCRHLYISKHGTRNDLWVLLVCVSPSEGGAVRSCRDKITETFFFHLLYTL